MAVTTPDPPSASSIRLPRQPRPKVALFWHPAADDLKVCVRDHMRGGYFEIWREPHQALDVFSLP